MRFAKHIQAVLSLAVSFTALQAQFTFQKSLVYEEADVQMFDAVNTSDGGYALAGIAGTSPQEMLLVKLDSCAQFNWSKTYGTTSSVQNVWIRLMETSDHHLVMVHNNGSWFSNNMNVVVVKTTLDGTLVWKRQYGGNRNDIGMGLIETQDGHYVICGGTGSYGSDAGSSYEDAFVLKLDTDGNVVWSKTLGNSTAYDDAYSVAEDPADGSLLVGGRYIINGTFYSFMAKLSAAGSLQWLRGYGRDNHANNGYAVLVDNAGSYLMAGSTTTLGADFQSYGDPFLIKADPATGDTLWARVYPPSDYSFDNASALVQDADGNYAMMVATASYSSFTVGFVPNKHALFTVGTGGSLLAARIYNQGGSHYPYLHRNTGGGYLISGFSNQYTQPCCNFQPLLIRTDDSFQSGCNETDVFPFTGTAFGTWQVETPPYTEGTGFTGTNLSGESDFAFDSINTLCTNETSVTASFTVSGNCATQPVLFTSTSAGNIASWQWSFSNGMTSAAADTSIVFGQSGGYSATLTVMGLGCATATTTQTFNVSAPTADAGPDYTIMPGESVTIGGNPTGTGGTISWSPDQWLNNAASQNPHTNTDLNTTTVFVVTVTNNTGCFAQDSMTVFVLEPPLVDNDGELFIPNIFSPNADGTNDVFNVYGGPLFNYHFTIYNRWGEVVFESTDQQVGWNGYYRGVPAQAGMYVYRFEATNAIGQSYNRNGTFTLLR